MKKRLVNEYLAKFKAQVRCAHVGDIFSSIHTRHIVCWLFVVWL